MELIRGWHNLRERHRGCVATIGNFDGVHRGHQVILKHLAEEAARRSLPATLILFEPQPLEFFRPDIAPPRLTSLRDKVALLRELGLTRVLCLRFNRVLAQMEPERFIEEILVQRLGLRYLLVGDDFRFGRKRRGDFAMLQRAGAEQGFEVACTPTVTDATGERISSTRVRQALAEGDLSTATALLGHPYRISGRVRRGQALGRDLGFPTANIGFGGLQPAANGIFVVRVHGLDAPRPGVASIGTRPTVNGVEPLLEVHLLDFEGQLYGRTLSVEFLQWLRAEERFESVEAMQRQIARDADRAREFFAAVE